jgi:membrane protein DedA with SNARE-associated domain
VLLWLERRLISSQALARSREHFQRRGAWAIFLSRFLFSALGGITNLLAGAEEYPYRRFLLYDASGEAIGAIIPLSLGYIFGVSWEAVGAVLGAISLFVLTTLFTIYLVVRLIRMIRQRSAASIAKEEKLDSVPVVSVRLKATDTIHERRLSGYEHVQKKKKDER